VTALKIVPGRSLSINKPKDANIAISNPIPRKNNRDGVDEIEEIPESDQEHQEMLFNRQTQQQHLQTQQQNRVPLEQKRPAVSRMRSSSGTAPVTESFLTSSSNAKPFQPETTKIASRPSENLRNINANNRNYVPPAKRSKPNSGVTVMETPPLLSGSQRMTRNQFQHFSAPIDPKDMYPTNTFSQGIKENRGAKMTAPPTATSGTTTTRQKKPPAQPEFIDLLDDDNENSTSCFCSETIRVKRVFFGPFEQKSSLSTSYTNLTVDDTPNSRGFIIKFDFEKQEKIPFNAILAFQ
jgi:hypothetical protein